MTAGVYHLLSETEPFSEYRGGAISRWTANVLRDDAGATIVCPSTDDTWKFPSTRVLPLSRYDRYEKVRRIAARLPWPLRRTLLRTVLLGGLERLNSGDILWVHNRPESAFALAPLVHAAGARLVLHMHNSHLLEQPAHRIQGAGIDRFVFVSKYLEGESRERFPGIVDSTVLYNGADESMFSPPSMGRPDRAVPQILFASRLVREKGAHIFLGAMRQLAAAGVKAKGIVVGAGHFGGSKTTAYIGELHAMAPPNVELRPYCSGRELAEMFREVDVFCLPSVWQDPFPLAPLEAMACRLPVVATLSGGIPEAFAEGGAILVARGSVDELAAALRELVTTPDRRRELGAAGYVSFHKNFTWGIVRQRYRRIIESLS